MEVRYRHRTRYRSSGGRDPMSRPRRPAPSRPQRASLGDRPRHGRATRIRVASFGIGRLPPDAQHVRARTGPGAGAQGPDPRGLLGEGEPPGPESPEGAAAPTIGSRVLSEGRLQSAQRPLTGGPSPSGRPRPPVEPAHGRQRSDREVHGLPSLLRWLPRLRVRDASPHRVSGGRRRSRGGRPVPVPRGEVRRRERSGPHPLQCLLHRMRGELYWDLGRRGKDASVHLRMNRCPEPLRQPPQLGASVSRWETS